jgi:Domain of unknown function (DUF3471)
VSLVRTVAQPSRLCAAEAIAATFLDDATYGKPTVNWLSFLTTLLGSSDAPGDPDYSKPPANGAPAQSDSTYVGTYSNDYYGRLTIVAKDGGPVMQLGPKNMNFGLTHYDGSTFSNVLLAETPPNGPA